MIEKEIFEEIRKLFTEFDYHKEVYKSFWKNPSVDELIDLAFFQMSNTVSSHFINYGWLFRTSDDPETGKAFDELEQLEDTIYGEFINFFDFYYKYRTYSAQYKVASFENYLELQNKTKKSS